MVFFITAREYTEENNGSVVTMSYNTFPPLLSEQPVLAMLTQNEKSRGARQKLVTDSKDYR